jgi:hypothetical protein
MYPYRAYIETLLSYGPAAKESQLTGVMWYVPHWSELVVLQANPIPISYIRKSFGVLEPFLTEDVFRCVP